MSLRDGGCKVSVIIPTFNRAFSLNRCINSVLAQSYSDLEIIIVDDGSTDNTFEIVQPYLKDLRVRYIKQETNKGAQAARNRGIMAAAGDYIAFLDSDDEWVPEKLQIQLDEISKAKQLRVIHGGALYVREGSDEKERYYVPKLNGCVYKELLANPGPLFQCILAPKSYFEEIGYLDECVPSWQEWDTSIALAKRYEFAFCDQPLAIYYFHGQDTISKDKKRSADGIRYIVDKYKAEIVKEVGKPALSEHYLKIYALYGGAGVRGEAVKFLLRSILASPNAEHVSILKRLFFRKITASMVAKSYRLCRRKKREMH